MADASPTATPAARAPQPAMGFRQALVSRRPLRGAFVKSSDPATVEILGRVGFDFVVIDAEHAPLDRQAVDRLILAARAARIAPLVRVEANAAPPILSALDCGAEGVLVPHVRGPAEARAMVEAGRYGIGRRGFSPSGRAGGYGAAGIAGHLEQQDRDTALIAMIEDPEALETIEAILATDGLTGIFVGQADLAVAMGAQDPAAPQVQAAVSRILDAARDADVPACLMAAGREGAARAAARGATGVVLGGDLGFLFAGAARALADAAG